MLNKIFGKKESKFFLELKDTDGGKPAPVTETPAPAVEAPAAEAPAPKKGASKKTSVKKTEKAAPKAAPAPVAAASTNGKVEPKEVEFATKYLITPPASRRLPGPSLNPFKDMARTAKVPRR